MRSQGLLTTTVILAVIAASLAGAALALLGGGTISQGVHIASIDVGGLTVSQAEERVGIESAKLGSREVVLRYPEKEVRAATSDLGMTMDVKASVQSAWQLGREGNIVHRLERVIAARRNGIYLPLSHSFDKSITADYLNKLAADIDRPAQDAKLVAKEGSVTIVPERKGIKLAVENAAEKIRTAVNSGTYEIDLPVETTNPEVYAKDLQGINGVLAHYATRFKPWEKDRSHNLMIACRSIDGTILKPGDVFSYNKIVGPRLEKYGFRDAPIFVNGEVEAGTGGGICQVCTTIYNAALLGNLKILRRSHHSRPVHYAPVGRDATVAWPSVDFKFRNDTDSPIYVAASLKKNLVDVTIFGNKQDDLDVQIVSEDHKVVPVRTVIKTDEDIPVNKEKPHSGHKVSIFRIVKKGGEIVRRELISKDFYRPSIRYVKPPEQHPAQPAANM